LLQLREIDEKLSHLRNRVEDGPRIFDGREREYKEAEQAVEDKREEITNRKLKSKEQEVDLKGKEVEIQKLEVHLLTAKTNEEYSSLQKQINRLKDESGMLEEAILRFLDGIESHSRELGVLERELDVQRADLNEFKSSVDRDLDEYSAEIGKIEAERDQVIAELNFDSSRLYEKIGNARGGHAVVSAEGSMCNGCFMAITPNDMARLRGMRELVCCRHCQRILYLPDCMNEE